VYKGILSTPKGDVEVAVKMAKSYDESGSTEQRETYQKLQREVLRGELMTMGYLQKGLGGHENILKLIGAITIMKAKFCILTEFCEWGSLDQFLCQKFKHGNFLNEIVPDSENNVQFSNGDDIWKVCTVDVPSFIN
jgi:hypothetical protein